MFTTTNSVKSLRKYYKNRLEIPTPENLQSELAGQSDRAAIILTSALLEDVLLLRMAMSLAVVPTEKEADYIFRFEGPLGTFSARLEVAYLFGIIDDLTRGQLDDIREMRNACAHSKHQISFDTPVLANVARRLFYPRGVSRLPGKTADDIRDAFRIETTIIYKILLEGSREKGVAIARAEILDAVRAAERTPSPDTPPQQ